MTDALVELGDYPAAVEAAQRMVDLRPDAASYSRISYLRQLHGDVQGAVDAMRLAVESANPQNPESVAWSLVQLGDILMLAGKKMEAEREFDRALFRFPNYHAALAAKGRARMAANDPASAIDFYERAVGRVPLPDYATALGDLYASAGRGEDAKKQYALVEFVERSSDAASKTYSRELALFWADHDKRLDEAVTAARYERSVRNDIYTNDVLAWCLYKNGQTAEAKAEMDQAMRLGTRDPRLFYHAGMIAHATGDARSAEKYLNQAVAFAPFFSSLQIEVARRTLATIKVS
jgi:tetratricopeptide (TPR) repeat protein